MRDSKLVELLRTLTTRQRTRFGEYVHSPFFNKHEQVRALCDYLLKQAPEFEDEQKLDKHTVFKAIYPQKQLDEDFLYNLLSKLLHLLYDFLAQLQTEQKPQQRQRLLLAELRQRKLGKHYQSALRKYQALASQEEDGLQEVWEEYALANELDRYFIAQAQPVYDPALQQKSDALDHFFALEKLRIACDMANRNIVVKANYQCRWLDQVLQQVQIHQKFKSEALVQAYWLALQTLRQANQENFYLQLRSLLAETFNPLPKQDRINLYNYGLNYCVRKINEGQTNYYQEAFELYQELLKDKLLYVDDCLPAWEYKNIVTAALRTGRYDWAEDFIEAYREDLPLEHRDNAYTYNRASFYYAKGLYTQALQTLHEVQFLDTTYHLGAKIIQVKSYYELHEAEALQALIDAFSMYLHRNRHISDYRKEANFNFLKITKKLFRLKVERDLLKKERYLDKLLIFERELAALSPLANRDWLEQEWLRLRNDLE